MYVHVLWTKLQLEIDNKCFENGAEFKYSGITLTKWNCMHEFINSRLNSGNAYYHLAQHLLSCCLLSIEVKVYRTVILPAVLYWCETWSLTLWAECRLRVFKNIKLKKTAWGASWFILLTTYYQGDQIKEDEVCCECGIYEGEVYMGFCWINMSVRDHLEDISINGRIILEWILKE